MTTKVEGKKLLPGNDLRFVPVSDILSYYNGVRRAFESYLMGRNGSTEHRLSVTDGPTGTLLHWEQGVNVYINGKREDPPPANYQLEAGSTLVATGPVASNGQAELTVIYSASEPPEKSE